MDRFLATFKLTYINKVKTKSFLIFTGLVVLLILVAANANKIIDFFDDGPDEIGVATTNSDIYKVIKEQGDHINNDAKFTRVSSADLKKQIRSEKLNMGYVITEENNKLTAKILSKDSVDQEDKQNLETVLTTIQTQMTAAQLNLSQAELKELQSKSKVESEMVSTNKDDTKLSEAQKSFNIIVVYAGLMLMFFIIINYASQIAMEIATEKTSRVIEMIITSVSPITHILAKITGVIAVALTQIAIFVLVGILAFFAFDMSEMLQGFEVKPNELTLQIVIVGIINLIIGILSYVILATILGSITSRIEDINQALMPMTLISMIAFYVSLYSVMNNDTLLTKITSFIPLFSPFVMFVRAASPEVQLWEIVVSIVLAIIVTIILLWIAIKSYKDSVLSFDKSAATAMKKVFGKR
ncbi:ABC transporter permease [Staphylococcus arlettae]|uniref:ABC transporter permease n=1 Tax=Staphylococcus arlettae TaxID=29378 RepID=UPI0011A19C59|nr:ABC transporter permease [Staphylococcus arlettae]